MFFNYLKKYIITCYYYLFKKIYYNKFWLKYVVNVYFYSNFVMHKKNRFRMVTNVICWEKHDFSLKYFFIFQNYLLIIVVLFLKIFLEQRKIRFQKFFVLLPILLLLEYQPLSNRPRAWKSCCRSWRGTPETQPRWGTHPTEGYM